MKTTILKDVNDASYIGFEIDQENVAFNMLLSFASVNIPDFVLHNNLLLLRNNNNYHITLFNVAECSRNKSLLSYDTTEINDLKMTGIGSISKDNKTTFFITCESKKLNDLRSIWSLNHKELHITIGFTDKDLFHEPKNNANILNFKL